jgi:hypothetical protein
MKLGAFDGKPEYGIPRRSATPQHGVLGFCLPHNGTILILLPTPHLSPSRCMLSFEFQAIAYKTTEGNQREFGKKKG